MRAQLICMMLWWLSVASLMAQKGPNKPLYLRDAVEVEQLPEIKNKYDRFKQQVIGHFSNQMHVKGNPDLGEKEQELIVFPIFKERTNEFWVYSEFFSTGLPEAPIDQKVIQFVKLNRDTTRMEVYFLKDPNSHINEWKQITPFEGLTKDDLRRDAGCDILIVGLEENGYGYKTILPHTSTCALQAASGSAQFLDTKFELSDEGYKMFFIFYDKNKNIVRESSYAGINFTRLNYKTPGYTNYAPTPKKIKKPKKTKK